MARQLRIEELEERIAPTVIAAGGSHTFTDGDGDSIQISYFGPDGSQADALDGGGGALGSGDSIGWINITGSDYTSVLLVENLAGGDGRTDILDGVQSTTVGADFGVIALGVGVDGANAGEVDLAADAQVLVDGGLGMFLINGDVDFDMGGHLILAEGGIGLVEVRGDMALDPTNGASIVADAGTMDVSFIYVGGGITDGTGGAAHATVPVGTGLNFADDVGAGLVNTMTVKVVGTGEATLIPILGGGSVLSRLEVSDGASVAITGIGAGGDVTEVFSAGSIVKVSAGGAADTDIYSVSGAGVGTVVNTSAGGDIMSVESTGNITAIQTGRAGNLGAVFTGLRNSFPLVAIGGLSEAGGTSATGAIGTIRVGAVVNTSIDAASIGSTSANPGGISGVDVSVTGSIGSIQAADIEGSTIYAETGIGTVRVGAAGIFDSTISSRGLIGSIQTNGSITGSEVTAEFESGGNVSGGSIGTVRAGSIFSSSLTSFGGFSSVKVRGAVVDSLIDARFTDTFLGEVGGGITTFAAGGVYGGSIVDGMSIGTVTIGAGGLVSDSSIRAEGGISRVSVRGDITDDSSIIAGGALGSVTVSGDVAYDGLIWSGGNALTVNIGGEVIGGGIVVGGDLGRLNIRGGIHGVGSEVSVVGNTGSISISGGTYGADWVNFNLGGDVGSFTVRGGMTRTIFDADGDVGSFNAAAGGAVYTSALSVGGNLSNARMRGSNTTLSVGGDLGTLQMYSDVPKFTLDVGGNTGSVAIKGTLTNAEIDLEGSVGKIAVSGDLNNSMLTFGADGSPVAVGTISVGGGVGSSQIDTWGNIASVSIRGSVVSSGMETRGNLTQMSVGRGIYGALLRVHGATSKFSVTNAVHESQTLFDGGVADYRVRGSIYDVDIGTTNYDGGGNPQGGAIGRLTATDISGANIFAYGGIGEVNARGTIFATTIEAVGRDNSGAGSVVGGGSITKIAAKGLNNTEVLAYGSIGSIVLNDEGIDAWTTIETLTGDLGLISTRGLIFGDVTVAGDVTGSILSAGTDAVDLGTDADLNFCDANGNVTGGELTVGGNILGLVS